MIEFLERIPGRVYDGIFFCSIIALVLLLAYLSPVHAAPSAKMQPAGCTTMGTVGVITISRCVDEQGDVLFANSAGYMLPGK